MAARIGLGPGSLHPSHRGCPASRAAGCTGNLAASVASSGRHKASGCDFAFPLPRLACDDRLRMFGRVTSLGRFLFSWFLLFLSRALPFAKLGLPGRVSPSFSLGPERGETRKQPTGKIVSQLLPSGCYQASGEVPSLFPCLCPSTFIFTSSRPPDPVTTAERTLQRVSLLLGDISRA